MAFKFFRHEQRYTLYFRLSLVWFAALLGGCLYLFFNNYAG